MRANKLDVDRTKKDRLRGAKLAEGGDTKNVRTSIGQSGQARARGQA
jgi:hypothetical protein